MLRPARPAGLVVLVIAAVALAGCTGQPQALPATSMPWSGLTDVPGGFADGRDNDALSTLTCAPGEGPVRNVSAWECAAPADAATYRAGQGLTLEGSTFAVDDTEVQARVADRCPTGQAIRAVLADGGVACQAVTTTAAMAPRVALASLASDRALGTGCSQVLRVDLAVPAAGKVVVEASAYVIVNHEDATGSDQVWAFVDDAEGSCTNFVGGLHVPGPAGVGTHGSTISGRAIFDVARAGTVSYFLRMTMGSGQDAGDHAEGNDRATTLLATWFPA